MRIAIVTGSYPPDVCGVSDYTEKLEQHLNARSVTVHIYTGREWSLRRALANAADLGRMGVDIVHMQYPATGYGWSLGPQLMALARRMVLTVHEASQAHLLRRLSLYPFSLRAPKIIFTNEYEQRYAQRAAPWIRHRSTIIPIGSNIAISEHHGERLKNTVTYFGIIRPEKGLEKVLELAELCGKPLEKRTVRIVGRLMPGREQYYRELRSRAEKFNVKWQIDLAGEALSDALAVSDICYVPFPDGASERRSSLIALLANGAAVVTTKGEHTPSAMEQAMLFADSSSEALEKIRWLEANPAQKLNLQQEAANYAQKFRWDEIAMRHISLYEEILRRPHFK